jgi:hypothetical protein
MRRREHPASLKALIPIWANKGIWTANSRKCSVFSSSSTLLLQTDMHWNFWSTIRR